MIKRFLLLLFLTGSIALAQEATPTPQTNWCDAGNYWGDGRCDTGNFDTDSYMWQMGWYLARLQEGVIRLSNIPEPFRPVIEELPPVPTFTPAPLTEWEEGPYTCYYDAHNYNIKTCYLTCNFPYHWDDSCNS